MILTDDHIIKENTAKGVWGERCLHTLFEENVKKQPQSIALVDGADRARFCEGAPRRFSYQELDEAVSRVSFFFAKLGLGREDVLVSQLPNTSEQIIVLLAALRRGIIVSPLPLMWRDHEIVPALEMIKPKCVITMSRVSGHNYAEMMREVAFKTSSVRFVLAFGAHLPDGVMSLDEVLSSPFMEEEVEEAHAGDANEIATICWTCNSETDSCPVPRSHNQWLAAGMMSYLETGLAEETEKPAVILNPYPLTNLVPIAVFLVPWLQNGGTLVLHHPFDMDEFQSLISDEKVTYTGLPPSLVDALSGSDVFQNKARDNSLKTLITVWPGPIIAKKGHEWGGHIAREGLECLDLRPLGELAFLVRRREMPGSPPARLVRGMWNVPSDSGHGLDLLEVQLKGSAFKNGEAASLLSGDLSVKTPMMFDQYFTSPENSTDKVSKLDVAKDGFVSTGLRGVYIGGKDDEAKKCEIDVVGRSPDVIFHGGLSISAKELDQLYAECDQLSDAAAFSFEDPIMGERIMAAVVPQPGETITLDDFIDYLNMRKVAPYKLPDRIIAVNSIPRNDKGNVLRAQVLEDR